MGAHERRKDYKGEEIIFEMGSDFRNSNYRRKVNILTVSNSRGFYHDSEHKRESLTMRDYLEFREEHPVLGNFVLFFGTLTGIL